MPEWVIAVISIAGSALISGVVGYLVKRTLDTYFKKKDKEQQDKDKEQQAKEEKLKKAEELLEAEKSLKLEAMINKVIEAHTDPIDQKLDLMEDKLTKVANGTVDTLRDRILSCYYKCLEKGHYTQYDYENIHHMNTDYINLDGNTFVAECIRKFDELPSDAEWKLKQSKPRKKRTSTN